MSLKRAKVPMIPLLLALGGALAACGGDDKDSDGNSGDGDGDGDGDGQAETVRVINSVPPNQALPGLKLRFFNPEDGTLYDEDFTSNGDGKVTATRPEGAGVFVFGDGGDGAWSDTWNHPPSMIGEEDIVRVSSAQSATIVPANAGYTNDLEASPLAGSILWHNAETGEDEYVGCATVEAENGKDIRYFSGALPAALSVRSAEAGTKPFDADANNNLEAGKFFVANLAAGEQTVVAKVNGQVIGTRTVFIVPRKDGQLVNTNPDVNSNVHLANIYVDESFTSNPQPDGCQ